jgi:hypothetical protein
MLTSILMLVACTVGQTGQTENGDYANTYPSQFLTGDVYILKSNERISGNISGIGTTLIIEKGAVVTGDISLIGGNLEINGEVGRNVNVIAVTAKIGDTAVVDGSINQIFNQTTISPDAIVKGQINTYMIPFSEDQRIGRDITNLLGWLKPGFWLLLQAICISFLLVFTLIITALFKKPTFNVIAAVRKSPVVAWGAGLLTLIAIPLISAVLIVTICLSPLGLILLLATLICTIWSWAVISNIVGIQMTKWLHLEWNDEGTSVLGAFIVGIMTSAISLIPIGGFLVNLFFCSLGLGGVLLSRFGTYSS